MLGILYEKKKNETDFFLFNHQRATQPLHDHLNGISVFNSYKRYQITKFFALHEFKFDSKTSMLINEIIKKCICQYLCLYL